MYPNPQSSNLMFSPEQLNFVKAELAPLVEAKLKYRPDSKDLVASAISVAFLDGQLAALSSLVKAHEATLKLMSTPVQSN